MTTKVVDKTKPEVREIERFIPRHVLELLDRGTESIDPGAFMRATFDFLGAKDGKPGMQAFIERMWGEFDAGEKGSLARTRVLESCLRMLGRIEEGQAKGSIPISSLPDAELKAALTQNLGALGAMLEEKP